MAINSQSSNDAHDDNSKRKLIASDNSNGVELEQNRLAYRTEVINDYLKGEREHVRLLERINSDIIVGAIGQSQLLSSEEMAILLSNIDEVLGFTKIMLTQIEEQQHIGGVFIDAAPNLQALLRLYCENHCAAVELINKRREVLAPLLSSTKGADIKELIVGLSMIFRRLDKYAVMLQEVERNSQEVHPDRGNLQRACAVYRDLHAQCEHIRKQKEAQAEFLASGVLSHTIGKDYGKVLGEFLHIANITVVVVMGGEAEEQLIDRCIAVFSKSILLMESTTTTINGYTLKSRLCTQDLQVTKDDSTRSLHFHKGHRTLVVMRALAHEDYERLAEALINCPGVSLRASDKVDSSPARPNRNATKQEESTTTTTTGIHLNHELEMILPAAAESTNESSNVRVQSTSSTTTTTTLSSSAINDVNARRAKGKTYSGWALRAYPPSRGDHTQQQPPSMSFRMRKGLSPEEQEDAELLRIIDGYCAGSPSNSNPQLNMGSPSSMGAGGASKIIQYFGHGGGPIKRASSYPDEAIQQQMRPQLIVAEQEKLFVEEVDEKGEMVVRERSLVDTVYALKDKLVEMQKEMLMLTQTLEKEQKARRRLEESLRRGSAEPVVAVVE